MAVKRKPSSKRARGNATTQALGSFGSVIADLWKAVAKLDEDARLGLKEIRVDLERMEGCIRDMQRPLQEALGLERQRLAKERDFEHRQILSSMDAARHGPERAAAVLERTVRELRGIGLLPRDGDDK